MRRKIVKHGPSTLIISLPSSWVKNNGIQKGDELEIREQGRNLVIGMDSSNNVTMKISQDISSLNPQLLRPLLVMLYKKGYDRIYLVHKNPELLKQIREKTMELMGYEIIDENSTYCIIQSISAHIDVDFDNSLRKTFLITKQMMELCSAGYKESDVSYMMMAVSKDVEVNKFSSFCLRQINKGHYASAGHAQQTYTLYYLIELLEEIADSCKRLADVLATLKKRSELADGLDILREQFDCAYSYFYKPSVEKANLANKLFAQLEDHAHLMLEKKAIGQEALAIYLVLDAARKTRNFVSRRLDFLKEPKEFKI